MTSITVTAFRQNIYQTIAQVNNNNNHILILFLLLAQNIYQTIAQVNNNNTPITITSTKGKGAILVGEDDQAAIEETLLLSSAPDMIQSLQEGQAETFSDCVTEDQLEW